ncbi:MAG: porin [Alphaproteobacteria bacterium]
MKMVKSLLLGSAAGLVAVAGAQAADLPVKAKPVEYVKICSIYGAGFFYIPGTDTCIKIGGWVRAEYGFQTGNSSVEYNQGASGRNNRIDSNEYNMRARWTTSIDVRTQTEYGTLRAYSRAGFQTTTGETAQGRIYTERGFIQFAGFTFGKSQSYFDFFGGAFCYGCSYTGAASMTGAAGTLLASYTATFGNGFTATLSFEDNFIRRNGIWDASNDATNALVLGALPGPGMAQDSYNVASVPFGDTAATGIPDIVGSLRVDQAWGSAQVAGALHQLRAGYYGNNTTGAGASVLGINNAFIAPNDAYGWAVMAGVVINLPWNKGDKFYVEATFCEGAGAYCGMDGGISGKNNSFVRFNGANVAAAWAMDSVFGTLVSTNGATSQQLTRYFSLTGAFEHYWTPALRTDFWGSYTQADYNDIATTLFCSSPQSPVRRLAAPNTPLTGATVVAGCDPDWNVWAVGVRTIWNPAPQFDIGLEVYYTRLETKFDPSQMVFNFAGGGGRAAGVYFPSSENVWGSILRLQRNFWP